MGLFDRIFHLREAPGMGKTTCADEPQEQTKGGSFGSDAVRVADRNTALTVAAWYRGVELRANTMSQLVMQYQKKNDTVHGGNFAIDMRGDGKRLNYMLQVQPNPTMTAAQMWKQLEIDKIMQGNALIYVKRSADGEIASLWLCTFGSLNKVSMTYTLSYNGERGMVTLTNVPQDDVLHVRNTFSNDHGLTGVATLRHAREALSLAATNDKMVKDTAAKGGKMKLLLQEERGFQQGMGRANKNQLKEMQKKLAGELYDNDVILLNNIANVTPISQNLQQQDISTIRKFSVREVARYLSVPPSLLMDDTNSSYKTPEAATQEFLMRTIAPAGNDWEQELNAKLLGVEGWPAHRFKFDEDDLMRLDPKGRAEIGKALIESGVMCPDELRGWYDLPTITGGDRHFISTNLQPVDAPVVAGNVSDGGGKGGEG